MNRSFIITAGVQPSRPVIVLIVTTLVLTAGWETEDDYRPQYCGLARNADSSPYFVPFVFIETDKMAPVNFTGKWKLNRSENFDDFLKEMGEFLCLIVLSMKHMYMYYMCIYVCMCVRSNLCACGCVFVRWYVRFFF